MPPKSRPKSIAAKKGVRSKSAAGKAPEAAKNNPPAEKIHPEEARALTAKEAESLLSVIKPSSLVALADSTDCTEQLPARMALEYVGDKDLSWSNAQASLRTTHQFLKEILEMEAGEFITRGSLARLADLGTLDLIALQGKNDAARTLATFLDACMRSAKERLGISDELPLLQLQEEPPSWPLKVDFKEIQQHISEAVRWRKTPLVVCNGHHKEVDTFLTYRAYAQVDAKWVLGETAIRKTTNIDDMREDLRRRLVSAIKNGIPLHVAMENTAVAFKKQICADGLFPDSVFNLGCFDDLSKPEAEREYKRILRDSDLSDWAGAFPGRLKDGFFTVVTTAFGMESAEAHLSEALPFFSDMAVIEIDPASFS